jgi:hypothetical protein
MLDASSRQAPHPAIQPRIGVRITHESGQWHVRAGPFTTAGGKTVNVRVESQGHTSSQLGSA